MAGAANTLEFAAQDDIAGLEHGQQTLAVFPFTEFQAPTGVQVLDDLGHEPAFAQTIGMDGQHFRFQHGVEFVFFERTFQFGGAVIGINSHSDVAPTPVPPRLRALVTTIACFYAPSRCDFFCFSFNVLFLLINFLASGVPVSMAHVSLHRQSHVGPVF